MSTIASHSPLNISKTVSDRPRGLFVWFQRTINRIWPAVTVGSRRCGLSKCLTSCASYDRLSGHCLKMRVKHWSRRSSPVAWTTATLCSRLNRLQLVQNDAACLVTGTRRSGITSRCCVSYIGYRYASASTLSLRVRPTFTVRSLAFHHHSDRTSQRPPSFCRCSRATTVRSIHNVPNMHCNL